MNLRLLSETPWAIPCLANWYYEEWGHLKKGSSVESITDELQSFLNSDKIPLIVVAVEGNTLLGAAKLRYYEMSIYPEKEHWLGGVYVSQKHRGNGIAEHIISKITSTAMEFGVENIHLQTEHLDGGLYSRLGWQTVEHVTYRGIDVVVMEKEI